MTGCMPVAQVAFTTLDIDATAAWYQDVFGLLPTGEMRGVGGPDVAAFTGLPTCECDMVWLADTSDFFQLEFFQFHDPVSVPGSRCPNEPGWSLIGLYVDQIDAVLAKLRKLRAPVGPVLGAPGDRRVCVRDPDGVWLELRERVPGGPAGQRAVRDVPVTTAFARAVVTDLALSREFFVGVLGLGDASVNLHTNEDERLWGAPAVDSRSCVLAADGDVFQIELVQYESINPTSPRRVCDQGILNVGFGSRLETEYCTVVDRVRRSTFGLHAELALGSARAHYAVGPDNLSVELLTIPPTMEREFGFVP